MSAALPTPATLAEITPGWLTAVLHEDGVLAQGRVAGLAWERIGEDRGFTGVVARLRPCYVGLGCADSAPASLVAKLPTAERTAPSTYRAAQQGNRAASRRHYARCAREVHCYREIAPLGAVPAPRLFFGAADEAAAHVVLLLEDVVGARAGDVLGGCSADDARRVLDAIAPLHARWWDRVNSNTFPWLPAWSGDREARQARYDRQVDRFLERFGHQIPPPILGVVERLRTRYAAVRAALERAPTTVIHADLHLDNVLFNPPGADPPAMLLDWQSVSRGAVAVDVAFFVFGSLAAAERRTAADDLLRRYHARLVEQGVGGYSLRRLRDDCRLALLCQLAGTVGWLAAADLDHLAGRERALVDAALGDGRLVGALLDLDAAALLA